MEEKIFRESEVSMCREVENKSVWFCKSAPTRTRSHKRSLLRIDNCVLTGGGGDKFAEMGGSNVRRVNDIKALRTGLAAHQ